MMCLLSCNPDDTLHRLPVFLSSPATSVREPATWGCVVRAPCPAQFGLFLSSSLLEPAPLAQLSPFKLFTGAAQLTFCSTMNFILFRKATHSPGHSERSAWTDRKDTGLPWAGPCRWAGPHWLTGLLRGRECGTQPVAASAVSAGVLWINVLCRVSPSLFTHLINMTGIVLRTQRGTRNTPCPQRLTI